VLALLSATCAVAIGVTLWLQEWKLDVNTYLVLAIGVGIWLATAYKFVRRIYLTELPMTTEGVMLGGSLLVHLLVLGVFLMREGNVQGEVRQGSAVEPGVPKFLGEKWVMRTKPSGAFVSSPITWNGRVYAASAHPSFKFGTLYCLESADKSQVWKFDDEGDLKQVFSTPTIADGRLFIGEGFHDDANCKLYCVDLETGMKLWHFETTSQTEARPTVADGRVFMGCGNDGFFCIDAKTGKAVWQFPHRNAEGRLLRFGAGAAVSGSRVFVGTGVDRNQKDDKGETAVLCLDAAKGILLWKLPVDLPVWSEPVIADGQLFVALGNGDLVSDDPFQPAGRLLCLEPSDGRVLWRLDLPNSVLEAPSVDAHYVYVGSRDGNCYCVGRKSGKIRWRTPLGSPVLATPVLAANDFGETESVFAVASGGKACCLDPRTGAALWTYDVGNQGLHFDARPALIVENIPKGRLRRLVLPSGDLGGGQKATLLCIEDRIED
jgi:outer membrane protein assembly factor BamB